MALLVWALGSTAEDGCPHTVNPSSSSERKSASGQGTAAGSSHTASWSPQPNALRDALASAHLPRHRRLLRLIPRISLLRQLTTPHRTPRLLLRSEFPLLAHTHRLGSAATSRSGPRLPPAEPCLPEPAFRQKAKMCL